MKPVTEPLSYIPVDYEDSSHRYSFGGVRYTSATQLLDQFKHHFDVEERSVYMADRYGNTPQYWKDKWKGINGVSLERGDDIHDEQERLTYTKQFLHLNNQPVPVHNFDQVYIPGEPLYNIPDGVYPEIKLWRHDKRIAGRSDKVRIYSTRTAAGTQRFADVEDYKTNKKIRQYSFQYPDGSYQMMKGPLSHLMDCEMTHYALQLSVYQYMLEYHGFYAGTRRIIHFPHEIEGLGTPRPVRHNLPYMRDEVIQMLNHAA